MNFSVPKLIQVADSHLQKGWDPKLSALLIGLASGIDNQCFKGCAIVTFYVYISIFCLAHTHTSLNSITKQPNTRKDLAAQEPWEKVGPSFCPPAQLHSWDRPLVQGLTLDAQTHHPFHCT